MSDSSTDSPLRPRKRPSGTSVHGETSAAHPPLPQSADASRGIVDSTVKIRLLGLVAILIISFITLKEITIRERLVNLLSWSSTPTLHGTLHTDSSNDGLHQSPSQLPSVQRRVVAIADIHGSLPNLLSILTMSHLITHPPTITTSAPSAIWSPLGPDDLLVSTGDNVDRGDDTIQIYQLWEHLRGQAGVEKVKTCLGNHEVMNALGDWRYVTEGDLRSFGGEEARRRAMSSKGWIGRNWLDHYNLSYTVDLLDMAKVRTLQSDSPPDSWPDGVSPLPKSYQVPRVNFVHGGHHPSFTSSFTLEELNCISHSLLTKALNAAAADVRLQGHLPPGTTQEEAAIWSADGPYWYRGYSYEKEKNVCKIAQDAMDHLHQGVSQFVMGHTPNFESFVHRCPARYTPSSPQPTPPLPPLKDAPLINLIDTGISPAYSGLLSSLVFETQLQPEVQQQTSTSMEEERGSGKGRQWRWVERRSMKALYKEQGTSLGQGEWEDLIWSGQRVIH